MALACPSSEPATLWWTDGKVECNAADHRTVAKMYALAQHLGADVVGDDGETYGPDGNATAAATELHDVRWHETKWAMYAGYLLLGTVAAALAHCVVAS